MKCKRVKCYFLMYLFLVTFIGCGCQNRTITIKNSERRYQSEIGYDGEKKVYTLKYVPQPDSIISVKARVVATQTPFIRSPSITNEIKTLFQLLEGENIPQKYSIREVQLFYYESQKPLIKNDIVDLLFDSEGNFIDIKFPRS